ncbi:MAG: sulfate reduction electron transfer complex DsrMKJOP subunit DsrM [Deltaproteobacteria bacterium]|nr:MAG: sulfate reduction electron transfer complex DsrMKJOP subunit DsrM [Deltaproteobacteria bacterium]
MGIWVSFFAVIALVLIPLVGAQGAGQYLFGIVIPYVAVLIFIIGFIYRVVQWGKTPVPFKIPTTGGQMKSLPWIKSNPLDNPSSTGGVIGRMALEVFAFRSLFRNTRVELREGPKVSYGSNKWLWVAALAFHYAFLVVFIKHFRLFMEPVPGFVTLLDSVDGFMEIGLPRLMMSSIVLLLAAIYLLLRRLAVPQLRYISLAADYFPLFLIIALAGSGILMKYFLRVDLTSVKELVVGLFSFRPTIPEGIGAIFYIHLFLLSVLIAYFPFSKLMHAGGVFMSPTRNMPNDNRAKRHINPWNYPVKVHTYDEYEDDFREKMKEVGLPVEKE